VTIEHPEPGSKPPDDRLRTLCAAARRVECIVCLALAGDECIYTTAPVSVPVTADTPLRPVRGYHVARFDRAASLGLITGADLEAVAEGHAPAAVIWDDGSAPREASPAGAAVTGPFESESEARNTPAVRAVYAAFDAGPGQGRMQAPNHRMLEQACEAAGVTLGAYDHRILLWLAGWEPQTCAVVAGMISRAAHPADIEAADIAIIRQALADASAWRTWRTEGDRAADTELAGAYERLLRRLITGQEVV
jgi:hypothetical protein